MHGHGYPVSLIYRLGWKAVVKNRQRTRWAINPSSKELSYKSRPPSSAAILPCSFPLCRWLSNSLLKRRGGVKDLVQITREHRVRAKGRREPERRPSKFVIPFRFLLMAVGECPPEGWWMVEGAPSTAAKPFPVPFKQVNLLCK